MDKEWMVNAEGAVMLASRALLPGRPVDASLTPSGKLDLTLDDGGSLEISIPIDVMPHLEKVERLLILEGALTPQPRETMIAVTRDASAAPVRR